MGSNYIAGCFLEKLKESFASVMYDGKPVSFSLPAGKTENFSVREGELEFQFTMKHYPEYDAVEWLTTVTNLSQEPSGILSDISVLDLSIPMPAEAEVVHRGLKGDNCTEQTFLPFAHPFACGETDFYKPQKGKSSHWEFPFFDLCEETDGLICGIGWTGTWCYELKRTETELRVKGGLPDARFYMKPQETLRVPRILLMGYQTGYRAGHNQFRKLMKEHYSPRRRFGDVMKMPVALQNFDRYNTTMPEWKSEEAQIKEVDFAKKCEF